MRLIEKDGVFVCVSSFHEKHIPKAAEFRWNPKKKYWWTDSKAKAARLIQYATPGLRTRLQAQNEERKRVWDASSAKDADIDVPVPDGLAYRPFQRAGIAYAMARKKTLIADEMGLGKTIQAIGVFNAMPEEEAAKGMLIVCPASLKLNWLRELNRWLVRRMMVDIASSKTWPAMAQVVIINYDILHRHEAVIREKEWGLLVCDEFHYAKNPKARRSYSVLGRRERSQESGKWEWNPAPIQATRVLGLTGTPIENRPSEFFPLIHYLAPDEFPKRWDFLSRYCQLHKNRFGTSAEGAERLDELQTKLRATCMVRRKKSDVLTELPPKQRQVITLDASKLPPDLRNQVSRVNDLRRSVEDLRVEVELSKALDPMTYQKAVEELKRTSSYAFEEMSRIRKMTAIAKVPQVVDHVNAALSESGKVVLFAHHREAISAFAEAWGAAAVQLTGSDDARAREDAVQRFQHDTSCRVFLGSITAAGVGITLTASSHVVFHELDWRPSQMSQAEDRCHRIGQHDSVLVQHLVLEGSVDEYMAGILIEKQEVLDAALDAETGYVVPDEEKKLELNPLQTSKAATESVSAADVDTRAPKVTEGQIEAAHQALRIVAGVCDGAREKDGTGFNGLDTRIGKSLAACETLTPRQAVLGMTIVRKYKRQFPSHLLEAMNMKPHEEEQEA